MTGGLLPMGLAAVLAALACGSLGVYVVHRRMALFGDAIAHTMLPGIVAAAAWGWSLAVGALLSGLLTALAVGWLARRGGLREDTAIGVLFTAMFALGLALAARGDAHEHLEHALFGSLDVVGGRELLILAGVAAVVLAVLVLLHKELELASCDPDYAEVIGIRTDRLRQLLLAVLALATVAGVLAVGVLLTAALLITPAATAALWSGRLPRSMLLAGVLAVMCSLVGLQVARHVTVPPSAAIVLTCTLAFAVSWSLRGRRRIGARPDV